MVSLGLTLESMGGQENRHFLLREIKSSASKSSMVSLGDLYGFLRDAIWGSGIGVPNRELETRGQENSHFLLREIKSSA